MAQAEVPMQYHSQIVHGMQLEEAILSAKYEVIEITAHTVLVNYYVITQRAISDCLMLSSKDWYATTNSLSAEVRASNHRVLSAYRKGEFSLRGTNAQVLANKVRSQRGFLCNEVQAVLDANSSHGLLTKECLVVVQVHSGCSEICNNTVLPSRGLMPDVNPHMRHVLAHDDTGVIKVEIVAPFIT